MQANDGITMKSRISLFRKLEDRRGVMKKKKVDEFFFAAVAMLARSEAAHDRVKEPRYLLRAAGRQCRCRDQTAIFPSFSVLHMQQHLVARSCSQIYPPTRSLRVRMRITIIMSCRATSFIQSTSIRHRHFFLSQPRICRRTARPTHFRKSSPKVDRVMDSSRATISSRGSRINFTTLIRRCSLLRGN